MPTCQLTPETSTFPHYLGTVLAAGYLCHLWLDGTVRPVLRGAASDALPKSYASEADFLTEVDAARFLNVPLARFQKWRRQGKFAYFQLTNKTLVIARSDLDALLRASRVEATTPPMPSRGNAKTPEHRAAIGEGQRRAWARRKAERES